MCELFCVSAALPTTVSFSLERLASHGAHGRANVDGWGLAFFEGRDVRLYKEPEPAGESAWLTYILERDLECALAISHIRRASQGALTHANTQPFAREMAGRMHVFAHNGDLRHVADWRSGGPRRFEPVGQTDSELAFCRLLEHLEPLWAHERLPTIHERRAAVEAFAAEARARGEANFLYSDGEALFAHSHRRPPAPGETDDTPGLWRLERSTVVDPALLAAHGPRLGPHLKGQHANLLASVPLTAEAWTPLGHGEVVVLHGGHVVPARG